MDIQDPQAPPFREERPFVRRVEPKVVTNEDTLPCRTKHVGCIRSRNASFVGMCEKKRWTDLCFPSSPFDERQFGTNCHAVLRPSSLSNVRQKETYRKPTRVWEEIFVDLAIDEWMGSIVERDSISSPSFPSIVSILFFFHLHSFRDLPLDTNPSF